MADLDEISEAIGGLRSDVRALNEKVCANREVADERHKENREELVTIKTTLTALVSDRNKVVAVIGVIIAGVTWAVPYFFTAISKKLGWN